MALALAQGRYQAKIDRATAQITALDARILAWRADPLLTTVAAVVEVPKVTVYALALLNLAILLELRMQ